MCLIFFGSAQRKSNCIFQSSTGGIGGKIESKRGSNQATHGAGQTSFRFGWPSHDLRTPSAKALVCCCSLTGPILGSAPHPENIARKSKKHVILAPSFGSSLISEAGSCIVSNAFESLPIFSIMIALSLPQRREPTATPGEGREGRVAPSKKNYPLPLKRTYHPTSVHISTESDPKKAGSASKITSGLPPRGHSISNFSPRAFFAFSASSRASQPTGSRSDRVSFSVCSPQFSRSPAARACVHGPLLRTAFFLKCTLKWRSQ